MSILMESGMVFGRPHMLFTYVPGVITAGAAVLCPALGIV